MISGTILGPFLNGQGGVVYRYRYVKAVPAKTGPITKSRLFRVLGALCLAVSVTGATLVLSPFITPYLNQKATFRSEMAAAKVQSVQPNIKNFLLTIDKIGLKNAAIIREVDASDKQAYEEAIKQGLAHAEGTAYPGEDKMIYIFGHSTNYPWFVKDLNALFFKLETLEKGDRIFIEYNGRPYNYYVTDKQIVKPRQVEEIRQKADEDILILQTCYPPGTFWERLLIFAKPNQIGELVDI